MSRSKTPSNWVDIDQLLVLFPVYSSNWSLYRAIRRGTFPVPTFRMGRKIYADKEKVRSYFRDLRDQANRTLESSSK